MSVWCTWPLNDGTSYEDFVAHIRGLYESCTGQHMCAFRTLSDWMVSNVHNYIQVLCVGRCGYWY